MTMAWRALSAEKLSAVAGVLAASGLVFATPADVRAGQRPGVTRLEPGIAIERAVDGAREDVYELRVPPGALALVVIEPRGVQMLARLLDETGNVAVEADDELFENRVELEIAAGGVHRIVVAPQYPGSPSGAYVIRAAEPRAATGRDRQLFEAHREHTASLIHFRAEAYGEARAHADAALRIRETVLGADHPDVAASLRQLGVVLHAQGQYAAAIETFRRAIAILERNPGADHPAVVPSILGLSLNEGLTDRGAEALPRVERALALCEARVGARHPLTAEALLTIAGIHEDLGTYAQGRPAIDRALEIAREQYGEDHLEYAAYLERAARYRYFAGDLEESEKLYTASLQIRERLAGPDSLAAARALSGLAYLALQRIRNLEAEELNRRVLAIMEKRLGPVHPDVAIVLNRLGLIAYRRRDFRTAEAIYLRALETYERTIGAGHTLSGYSLSNLGLVYWRQGDYPRAKEAYERALKVFEHAHGPDSLDVAPTLFNLGIIAKETGDYDLAEKHYLRALAISENAYGRDHPQLRTMTESIGILRRDRGDYTGAEPWFARTLAIIEQAFGPNHPDVIRHLQNIFRLQAARGDLSAALATLERSARIEEHHLPFNLAAGSERQKLAYFGPFASNLEEIVSFHIRNAPDSPRARDLAATTLLQRKGRVFDALADSLGALARRAAGDDRVRLDRLRAVSSELSALVLAGPRGKSRSDHQARIDELTAEWERLEDETSRRSAGRYARATPVTLAGIHRVVPAGAALVEFLVYRPQDPAASLESSERWGEPRYAAYVIHAGDVRWADLGPAADIDERVRAFREALQDPRNAGVKATARALDAAVMAPVRGLVGSASRLLVSPDGALSLVPFEAFVDENGRYLVERFAVTYLSAGRDLLRMQATRAAATGPPLVLADPVFGEPKVAPGGVEAAELGRSTRRSVTTGTDLTALYFAPIPGTRYEARSIQAIFSAARVLTGANATESALLVPTPPSILHIATHGFFLDDPDNARQRRGAAGGTRAISASADIDNPLLRSGLALAGANLAAAGRDDGILTALEAAHLDLLGTKLVTLSACDTGVGEVRNGEGVYGLRRSIFLAGAETLVMSLWPVDDAVTRELMTAYYKGLKAGLGRGDALRQVQRSMLGRKGREHPFYWASFIQAGEWGNLEGKR